MTAPPSISRTIGLAARTLRSAFDTEDTADGRLEVSRYLDDVFGLQTATDRAEILWLLEDALATLAGNLKRLQATITDLRIRDILEHGAIRLGDRAYKVSPNRARKLLVPVEQFISYCEDRALPLEEVFALSERTIRITAFRALLADSLRSESGDTAAQVEQAVRIAEDTFFEYADVAGGGDRLDELPLTEAKWAQTLTHRQRRPARKAALVPPAT